MFPADVTFHPSWWHQNAGVCFDERFFYDAAYRIEQDRNMRRALFEKFGDWLGEKDPKPRPLLHSDLIACGFLLSELLGAHVIYTTDNAPVVECKNMDSDEAANLAAPDLDTHKLWGRIQAQIDYLMEAFGRVEPCVNFGGVQNIALDLRGQELFIDFMENPDSAHHLLGICADVQLDVGNRLMALSRKISAGVSAIVKKTVRDVYLTSNCTVDMISEATYKEFLLPYDNKLAEVFPVFGVHHCGSTMEHVAGAYAQINNLAFAEVGAGSDLRTVRMMLPHVFLNARYSPVQLASTTARELRKDIDKLKKDGSPEALLSISCVGIDTHVQDGRVREFLEICTMEQIEAS